MKHTNLHHSNDETVKPNRGKAMVLNATRRIGRYSYLRTIVTAALLLSIAVVSAQEEPTQQAPRATEFLLMTPQTKSAEEIENALKQRDQKRQERRAERKRERDNAKKRKAEQRRQGKSEKQSSIFNQVIDIIFPAAHAVEPFVAAPDAPANAEINELARSLKDDVDLIFRFVYDNIHSEFTFGDKKGGLGAYLDQSGNSFDQATLLKELLEAAGYTAVYEYGDVELDETELIEWTGAPDLVEAFRTLSVGGHPIVAVTSTTVTFKHVWVKVTVSGTDYVLDPSIKKNDPVAATVDLALRMDFDEADFITDALAGSSPSVITDYVQDISEANIESNLEYYADELITYLRANDPDAQLEDLIGGSEIEAFDGTVLSNTSHPNQVGTPTTWTSDIPSSHQTFLTVQIEDIDSLFRTSEIYTARMTIGFTGSNKVEIRKDGLVVATSTTTAPSSGTEVIFEIEHPYSGTGASGLVIVTGDPQPIEGVGSGNLYSIVNSWGVVRSNGLIEKRRRSLHHYQYQGDSSTSETVLGETVALVGANWVQQADETARIVRRITGRNSIPHHRVGIAGQASGPYVDLPLNSSIAPVLTFSNDDFASFLSRGGISSALEHGVLEQTQPFEAMSTMKLLQYANSQGDKIYELTSANEDDIDGALVSGGWDDGNIADIAAKFDRTIIPEIYGYTVPGTTWNGWAYLGTNESATSFAGSYAIGSTSGGLLNGGAPLTSGQSIPNKVSAHNSRLSFDSIVQTAADPVELFRGSFLFDSDDIGIGPSAIPRGLGFQRSYSSSRRTVEKHLGLGWSHNFDMSAATSSSASQAFGEDSAVDAVNTIVATFVLDEILDGTDGRDLERIVMMAIIQTWMVDQINDNMVDIDVPGNTQRFTKLADGTYNSPQGSADVLTQEVDDSYKLTQKNGVVLDFDTDGKIEAWTDPNGNNLSFAYGGDDMLDSVSNNFGRTLTMTYDSNDRIDTVSDGTGRSVSYTYDSVGNLTNFTNAAGETSEYEYDIDGRLHKVYVPEYPKDTGTETAIVENIYDDLGRVKEQYTAAREQMYLYITGNRAEEVDPLGNSKIFTFNDAGRTLSETDGEGRTITSKYDSHDRLIRQTFPEENAVVYEYDDNHNITKIIQEPKTGSVEPDIEQSFTYESTYNKPLTATDARGNVTDYTYFPGTPNLQMIELPEPTVGASRPTTSFTYVDTGGGATNGLVATQTDPENRVTKFEYDPLTSDLKKTIRDEGTGRLNLTTEFTYDAVGNLASQTDPRDSLLVTTFEYDDERRLTKTITPAPFNYETNLVYDLNGRVIESRVDTGDTASPQQVTTTTYTRFDKEKSITNPLGYVTSFTYDAADRLISTVDAEGRETKLTYFDDGQIDEVKQVTAGGDVVVRKNSYTTNGRLATVTDAETNTTTFGYDDFDRPDRTTYPDSTYESVVYDAAGNVDEQLNRKGEKTEFDYDALNREISKDPPGASNTIITTYDKSNLVDTVTVNGTDVFNHDYDTAGRLNKVTRPDGKVIEYDYDEAGNRTSLTYPGGTFEITYEYDELGRPDRILEGVTVLADYSYTSRLTGSVSYANTTSSSYTLSLNGDLSQLVNNMDSESPTYELFYNKTGQLTNRTLSDVAYAWAPSATSADTYTPNSLNQYGVVNTVTHTYDNNGNLIGDGAGTYTYDHENRLLTATIGTMSATYEYDAFGRRVSKDVNGTVTSYVYDHTEAIEEYDGSTLSARYVYGPGVDSPIYMERGVNRYYYHFDPNGSVVALSDAGGTVIERYAYGPFGETDDTSSVNNPYLYTGRRFDAETGFYYYRNRYYSVSLGRFLQPDPIGFGDGLNVYAYVGNDPLNFVDPTGLLKDRVFDAGRSLYQAVATHPGIDLSAPKNVPAADLNRFDEGEIAKEGAILVGATVASTVAVEIGLARLAVARIASGPLPRAADSIDSGKIREIERRVRAGETSFPLDTGAQLRAVAESFATKIRNRLVQGKVSAAQNVHRAGIEAINRLDRFDPLTAAARQQLRDIVNFAFKGK